MSDLRQQLEDLRARVARVNARLDSKYSPIPANSGTSYRSRAAERPGDYFDSSFDPDGNESGSIPISVEPDHWPGSQEIETEYGRHLEAEIHYPGHRQHGTADIGGLVDLPHDLLQAISDGAAPAGPPTEWAFLDTETTGLSGGTGTCAFLIGVGRITSTGFSVRQFFMRDYGEECSVLTALANHLAQFRVLITYNGRTFDQPLLETRYRLNRTRPPFAKLDHHVDLLYGSRRLWKLRYESCRLVDLENQVLGVERQGDVPGALIPHLYFEYLRTRRVGRLLPIFYHNATDILTLACLTGIVPHAFNDPALASDPDLAEQAVDARPLKLRHGSEMVGVARWLRQSGDVDQAQSLFDRAIQAGLPDELLFRTLWDMALLHKQAAAKDTCDERALAIWRDLSASPNPFRVRAMEELAKYHEHRRPSPDRKADLQLALQMTREALQLEDSPALRHREQRLTAAMARVSNLRQLALGGKRVRSKRRAMQTGSAVL